MASAPNFFDSFASFALPAGLPERARSDFAKLARSYEVAQGCSFGTITKNDSLAYVASGSAKLVAHASAEREQVIAFQFAGDILVLPFRDTHSYSLHALRDCELAVFPHREFLDLAQDNPGVLRRLLERSTLSLHRCREKVIDLGRKTANERIVAFLLMMADRIGVSENEAVMLDLPMSRRDIGDSLGLTIETVSRQLTQLREEGAIETAGRSKITLLNIPELETRAGYLREVA